MKRIFSLFLAIIVASNFFAVYASAVGITIDNTAVSFSDAAPSSIKMTGPLFRFVLWRMPWESQSPGMRKSGM